MSDEQRPDYCAFYPSKWIGGCATLPPLAEWVMLQISLYNMDKGEPVPAKRLRLILARYPGDWKDDLELLIEIGKIHRTQSGGLFVKRALSEYGIAERALSKKRKAGKAGANARWNKGLDGSANGDAIENRCDTNGSREEKRREEKTEAKASDPPTPLRNGDLVFSVDPEALAEFKAHRIEIGKPLTAVAEKRLITKLEKIWREHGHDPAAVLRQSIEECWIGVFPLKNDGDKKSGWRFDDER